jgi:hypothetical protein
MTWAHLAQSVEHVLGKDEVISSILMVGSRITIHGAPIARMAAKLMIAVSAPTVVEENIIVPRPF